MRTVQKFVCWICKNEYATEAEALNCVAKGIAYPLFKIGDKVTYQKFLGEDRDGAHYANNVGGVIDILFPEVREYSRGGFALLHNYNVAYLVAIRKRGVELHPVFFDRESNQTLRILDNTEIVYEGNMVTQDGRLIRPTSSAALANAVATRWEDYAERIVTANPSLEGLVARFSEELRSRGCLD